ncbi:MAG: ROK family protein [Actinobacteria bacterium]|nr:MAG: ROK family protein [Actinomycetota bacterium]
MGPSPGGAAVTATIGVDLGGTKCLGVLLDDEGRVLAEHRVPTPASATPGAIVDAIIEVVAGLGGSARVGVGAPGLVDGDGVLRFAPNLPGVTSLALRAELERRLPGTTARVDNDATCAGWAEWRVGAARGSDHVLLITLGTGIGGGIVAGGRLERGANGFAGEIGHMVVDPHGPACVCGKRGCWERFASGSGLGRLAREAAQAGRGRRMVALAGGDPEAVRGEHVTRACAEGDAEALEVMRQFAWWLALGLVNLAYAFDPETFVIGGGLVEAGEVLLEPTRAAFADLLAGSAYRPAVAIVAAQLGERAGAIGAALVARE